VTGLLRSSVVGAAVLLLGGCGGGSNKPNLDAGAPVDALERPAGTPDVRALTLAACDGAFIPERPSFVRRWRRSTRVGAIRLPDMRRLAEPGLASRVGKAVVKVPVLIRPARVVTIEVDSPARSSVGFVEVGLSSWHEPSDLHPELRVENCPSIPPEAGVLPLGPYYALPLFFGLRRDTCARVTVIRNGGRPHRQVISSGALWMMRIESSWSVLPQALHMIVPRQSFETRTPVPPSGRYSMAG
jgi:hypothetical protein